MMTAKQRAAMEQQRLRNLREAATRLVRSGKHRLTDVEIWFLALPRGSKEGIKKAWDQHLEKQRP